MSSIRAAVREDTEAYLARCRRYVEQPRYIGTRWGDVPDTYGEHARSLRGREEEQS